MSKAGLDSCFEALVRAPDKQDFPMKSKCKFVTSGSSSNGELWSLFSMC